MKKIELRDVIANKYTHSFVQCFNFQNTSLCLLSRFIFPETSEASIITPMFSLGQWLIKDKWNAQLLPKGTETPI